MRSESYKSYGYIDCIHMDEIEHEPCWGRVNLVDVDDIYEGDRIVDEILIYACEGHAPMFPLSVLTPMGKYLPESSK